MLNPFGDRPLKIPKNIIYALFHASLDRGPSKADKYFVKHKNDQDAADYGLNDAIAFAAEVYADQKILDTETPFILQVMGTASLLGDLGGSPSLIISGLLAPAVADKLLTLKEVKERFGLRIAQMLSVYIENKTVPWFLRKLEYLNDVFKADDTEIEILALAVAISELRSIYRVYKEDEAVIYGLDAPCEAVAMYYKEAVKRMAVFAAEKDTEHAFRELADLYAKVFLLQTTYEQ